MVGSEMIEQAVNFYEFLKKKIFGLPKATYVLCG